ncbi:MAG: tetratricopeptide repeat protein, partial [Pseudomonadales bacterium]|nr:tetratricopeptide repeat protein [Pseudomonadales bacterium]
TTRWESRPPVAPPELSEIQKLFAEARSAFESGEYARAIELYSRLLEMTEGERRASALEMLGVSRELNRELPLAQQLYQSYLTQYPESEGAPRVRQRLAALLALLNPNRSQRRQTTRREPGRWRTASYLSQFYQRQSLEIDDDSRVPIDGIFSDASLLAMRNGTDLDQEIRVTLSYLLDFSDEEYPQGREFQVSSLYWDGYSERLRSGIKVGRQTRPKAGVLGRFDGAALTFRPLGNLSLDFTGGLLVDNAFESPDADRPFFGLGGEWISSSGRISVAPFYIRQEVDGVLDREAVGVQSYLRSDRMMLFSLLDYDLHYAALNNITLRGNFRFRESRLTASYEHRRSPYLTTRNAMIGQAYDGLSELETALLETQLEDIAEDRTATSDTLRLGVSLPLFENWMVTADLVASDYSSTETSADVIGLESYNTIYSSLQIRRNELFGPASYAALMFRQADSDAGGTSSLYWDNRFTLADSWLLYPRVRLDYRTFDTSGDTQWTVKPSLRLDFRYNPRVRFEFEMGYQWTTREMASRDLDITGLFVRAGYRANF